MASDQYVGREFYGVWGNFDVTIDAHRDYLIGGTGVLQNPDEVGFGYGGVEKVRVRKQKRRWHFRAERVHDFAFAADPDYVHQQIDIQNGPVVHLLFDPETANEANWELLKRTIYSATLILWLPILVATHFQFYHPR